MATVDPELFDLRGGRPCLDFVNTMGGLRAIREEDHLHGYADLVEWARHAGVIDRARASRLLARAARHPKQAAQALARAVALREALHRALVATVDGRAVDPSDLAALDGWIASAQAARALSLVPGKGFVLSLKESDELLSVLWPVALSAAEVLTTADLARVRVCEEREAGRCGWLFLDETKNRSRRFCSMGDCGNRAKQRRHYARTRGRDS